MRQQSWPKQPAPGERIEGARRWRSPSTAWRRSEAERGAKREVDVVGRSQRGAGSAKPRVDAARRWLRAQLACWFFFFFLEGEGGGGGVRGMFLGHVIIK